MLCVVCMRTRGVYGRVVESECIELPNCVLNVASSELACDKGNVCKYVK